MTRVVADEHDMIVAYVVNTPPPPDWDGTNPVSVSETTPHEQVAIVRFEDCSVFQFGYPNDHVLGGHPLFERGLGFYGFHEVHNSAWIAELARRNGACYPGSETYIFKNGRHYILTFKDSVLECIARRFCVEDRFSGTILDAIPRMAALLSRD